MSSYVQDSAAEHLYRKLVWVPDLAGAVASLEDGELRNLGRWLADTRTDGGVPLLIRGLTEAEAAERFLKQSQPIS